VRWSSLLIAVFAWAATADNLSLLENGSHCVAYKAQKTMFLLSSDEVVGKNCEIQAQVMPDVGGEYHIEVVVPIKGFNSENGTRDKDVAETLKVSLKPELMFKSKALTPEAWRELFAKGDFEIQGELSVGDKFYPVKLKSRYDASGEQPEVDGVARVKYTDFDIDPPRVGGGVIAKSKPEFELHFHLLGGRILGADSIRLEKK
jgi:hypothetical protein